MNDAKAIAPLLIALLVAGCTTGTTFPDDYYVHATIEAPDVGLMREDNPAWPGIQEQFGLATNPGKATIAIDPQPQTTFLEAIAAPEAAILVGVLQYTRPSDLEQAARHACGRDSIAVEHGSVLVLFGAYGGESRVLREDLADDLAARVGGQVTC